MISKLLLILLYILLALLALLLLLVLLLLFAPIRYRAAGERRAGELSAVSRISWLWPLLWCRLWVEDGTFYWKLYLLCFCLLSGGADKDAADDVGDVNDAGNTDNARHAGNAGNVRHTGVAGYSGDCCRAGDVDADEPAGPGAAADAAAASERVSDAAEGGCAADKAEVTS